MIQWCAVDVVIHLRIDAATSVEARRADIQFLTGICNRLSRYQTGFSWQANLFALVEHGQLCFGSLNFSLWSSLRCVSRGAGKFLQDNTSLHGNVTFIAVAVWPQIQSLRCWRSFHLFARVHVHAAITFSCFRRCKLFLLFPLVWIV